MIPVNERLSSKLRKDALADVISDYYGGYYGYYSSQYCSGQPASLLHRLKETPAGWSSHLQARAAGAPFSNTATCIVTADHQKVPTYHRSS